MLEFSCRAHLDEFVIDAEDPGTFTASDGVLTHTGNRVSPAVSVSVDEVESVSFERNTTLHRNRLLGVFFGILSVLLLALFYALVGLGTVESLNEAAIAGFVLVLGLGGLSTTHEYIRHENRDVIDVYVTTDDEQFVVCGRTDDDEFVDSCIDLADSDLPTTIRSSGLEPVLN